MTTFQTYVDEQRSSKKNMPTQDHESRWQSRIVAMGWDQQGQRGGENYLGSKWAKSIGADKCIAFARLAEAKGNLQFAVPFWRKAYEIETGCAAPVDKVGSVPINIMSPVEIKIAPPPFSFARQLGNENFPEHFRPGSLDPMQPVDGKQSREFYICNRYYWAQPKRDGEKLIIFATPKKIFYQSRSMKLQDAPLGSDEHFEIALKDYAKLRGSFILEGEAFYLDIQGDERMAYSTCLDVNAELGSDTLPVFVFQPFGCLLCNGLIELQSERIDLAFQIASDLSKDTKSIVPMRTYRTTTEKKELCAKQLREGREGEVFFLHDAPYTHGKSSKEIIIRKKYTLPPTPHYITDVLPGKADGHAIAGFKVMDMDGIDRGTVATGYNRHEQVEILALFRKQGAKAKVLCTGFGYTHTGKLRYGGFAGFIK